MNVINYSQCQTFEWDKIWNDAAMLRNKLNQAYNYMIYGFVMIVANSWRVYCCHTLIAKVKEEFLCDIES